MNAYFETAAGETITAPSPVSPELAAVVYMTGAVGIRIIDQDSLDEFVRRADLYDTHIGGSMLRDLETGETVSLTRKIIVEAMAGHPTLWTTAGLITQGAFDRMIRIAKESNR